MKLGFGLMRLPVLEDKSVDIAQLCRMVDCFLEKGGTYFDTAYVYHKGTSETAIKAALVNRHPRESFTLANKLPGWELKCREDVQRIFDEQLERCGVSYFDYYLLHSVEAGHLPFYNRYDCWNWLLEMKAKGLVRHVGFSFHDSPELLDRLLTEHPEMEFIQLQINYLDWENNIIQSRGCYEVAQKHNVPVVVMEPVKGGTLAQLPEKAARILNAANPAVSHASWALRFCASLDNVKMVLSGISDMAQMEDNLGTMVDFRPLSVEEKSVIAEVTGTVLSFPTIPCTGCRYCVDGCLMGIPIPDMIRCLNNSILYGKHFRTDNYYQRLAREGNPASACVGCGQCEGVCPQHLNVIEIMSKTARVFEPSESQ